MNITNHAEVRIRKRIGISKNCVDKQYNKALLLGKHHNSFKGGFKRYLDKKAITYGAEPIVYNQFIYWMHNKVLITVYPVPNQYKKYL